MFQRSLILACVLLGFTVASFAHSLSFLVTPENLNTHPISFLIKSHRIGKMREYDVSIGRKQQMDVLRFQKVTQGEIVKVTRDSHTFEIIGKRSVAPDTSTKDVLHFHFKCTPDEIKRLSFEVGFMSYAKTGDGKIQWMPSADFYYFRLKDFASR